MMVMLGNAKVLEDPSEVRGEIWIQGAVWTISTAEHKKQRTGRGLGIQE